MPPHTLHLHTNSRGLRIVGARGRWGTVQDVPWSSLGGGAPCQPWCMFASARLLCLCPLCAQVCCPPSWFTPTCEPGGSCCAPARPLPQAGEVTTGQRRSMGGQQEGEATSGLAGAPGGQGSVPGWTAGPSTAYIGHLAFSFHETCKGRSTLIQNPLMQLPVREAAKGDLRS